MVGGKQGHAPHIILSLLKGPSFVSVEFHGDHEIYRFDVNMATLGFGDLTGFKMMVCVC